MSQAKVKTRSELEGIAAGKRKEGSRIVFTNGCFDILHIGHIKLLEDSRTLGDILIVGLNSDDSVRRLKGPKRPIVSEQDRASILAALEAVDYVVIFDEDTPIETIKCLKPHIHVKGGDYDTRLLPETPAVEAYGGTVKSFALVPGHSSTDIIDRILSSHCSDRSERELPR